MNLGWAWAFAPAWFRWAVSIVGIFLVLLALGVAVLFLPTVW